MKTCSKCFEVKEISEFYSRKTSIDGVYANCKVCHRENSARNIKKRYPKHLKSVSDRQHRLKNRSDVDIAIQNGKKRFKTCNTCEQDLPLTKFYKARDLLDGHKVDCKRCCRDWHYRNHFGITIDDYEDMLDDQFGKCAICDTHQYDLDKRLCIDHNHEDGSIRGLLCVTCNLHLGKRTLNFVRANKEKAYLSYYGGV